jgi:hypothetical protein
MLLLSLLSPSLLIRTEFSSYIARGLLRRLRVTGILPSAGRLSVLSTISISGSREASELPGLISIFSFLTFLSYI